MGIVAHGADVRRGRGTIGDFKDGAFIIAVTSQVPIVPVTIHGTCRIWPPGCSAIHGGQVHIVVGSPC